MDVAEHVKIEIQVAARDANTRKLAAQLGKRHKWVAPDVSTGRHLSSIATIVLRNLGLDGGHQVILYPDVSVHTHLKSTPVSWGPIFDPTYQLRDAHKMFGSPNRLHFLYHVIAPEAPSPAGKTPSDMAGHHQHQQQHDLQPDTQPLQLRQLDSTHTGHQHEQLQPQPQVQHQQPFCSSQQGAQGGQQLSLQPPPPNMLAPAALETPSSVQQHQAAAQLASVPHPSGCSQAPLDHPGIQQLPTPHQQQFQQQHEQLARLYAELQLPGASLQGHSSMLQQVMPAVQRLAGPQQQQQQQTWNLPPAPLQPLIMQQPSLPVMSQQQHCQQLLLAQQLQQQHYLHGLAQLQQFNASAGLAWPAFQASIPGLSLAGGPQGVGGLGCSTSLSGAPGLHLAVPAATTALPSAGGLSEGQLNWPPQQPVQQAAQHTGSSHQQQQQRQQQQPSTHSQHSRPHGSSAAALGLGDAASMHQPVAAGGVQAGSSQADIQQQRQQPQQGSMHSCQQAVHAGQQHVQQPYHDGSPQQQQGSPASLLQLQPGQPPAPQQHRDGDISRSLQQQQQPQAITLAGEQHHPHVAGQPSAAAAASGHLPQQLQEPSRSCLNDLEGPSQDVLQASLPSGGVAAAGGSASTLAAQPDMHQHQRHQPGAHQPQEATHSLSQAQGVAHQGQQQQGQAVVQAAPPQQPPRQEQPGGMLSTQAMPMGASPGGGPGLAAAGLQVLLKSADGTMVEVPVVVENGRLVLQLPQTAVQAQQLPHAAVQQQQPPMREPQQPAPEQQQQQQQQQAMQQQAMQPLLPPMQNQHQQQSVQQQAMQQQAMQPLLPLMQQQQAGHHHQQHQQQAVHQQQRHQQQQQQHQQQQQQQLDGVPHNQVCDCLHHANTLQHGTAQHQQAIPHSYEQTSAEAQLLQPTVGGLSVAAALTQGLHISGGQQQPAMHAAGGLLSTWVPGMGPLQAATATAGPAQPSITAIAGGAVALPKGPQQQQQPQKEQQQQEQQQLAFKQPLLQQHQQAAVPPGFTESPAASPAIPAEDAAAPVAAAPVAAAAMAAAAAAAAAQGPGQVQGEDTPAGTQRSHCSSVSCGGAAADGTGPTSKLRQQRRQQPVLDVAGVGGSATRSGLRLQSLPDTSDDASDAVQEAPAASQQQPQRRQQQQQQQQQQRTSSSDSRDSLKGRGVLQPRQLQLQDAPPKASKQGWQQQQQQSQQQQQRAGSSQWQPQLECISEEHTPPRAADPAHAAASVRSRLCANSGARAVGTPDTGGAAMFADEAAAGGGGSGGSGRVGFTHSAGLQLELSDMDGNAAGPPSATAEPSAAVGLSAHANCTAPAAADKALNSHHDSPGGGAGSEQHNLGGSVDGRSPGGSDAATEGGDDLQEEEQQEEEEEEEEEPDEAEGADRDGAVQQDGPDDGYLDFDNIPSPYSSPTAAHKGPAAQEGQLQQCHEGSAPLPHAAAAAQQQMPPVVPGHKGNDRQRLTSAAGSQPSSKRSHSSDDKAHGGCGGEGVAAPAVSPGRCNHQQASQQQQQQQPTVYAGERGCSEAAPPAKRSRTTQHPASPGLHPPEDDDMGVPSIICKGKSAAGTWHRSTGDWDSRPEQTPMLPGDVTSGSIFSVAQLLQQQQIQARLRRQQQRQRGMGAGSRGSGRGGGFRAGPVPAGSLLQGGTKKGPSKAGWKATQTQLQHMQLWQLEQQQQLMPSLGAVHQAPSGIQGLDDNAMLQQLDLAEARVAAAAAAVAGGAAAAAAAGAVSSQGTTQSLSLAQKHTPCGSQTTTGAAPHQQRQQQQQQQGSQEWCGFQAAVNSGSPPSQGDAPAVAPPPVQPHSSSPEDAAAGTGAGGDQGRADIDFEGIQAILQSNSVLALEERYLQQQEQQQQGAGMPVAAGGDVSMRDALRTAGVRLKGVAVGSAGGAADGKQQPGSSGSSGRTDGAAAGSKQREKRPLRSNNATLPAAHHAPPATANPAAPVSSSHGSGSGMLPGPFANGEAAAPVAPCSSGMQAAGPSQPTSSAGGTLQRYTLPNGQVVFIAAQPPPHSSGAPCSSGCAAQPQQLELHEDTTGPLNTTAGLGAATAAATGGPTAEAVQQSAPAAARHGPPTAAQLSAAVHSLAAQQAAGGMAQPSQRQAVQGPETAGGSWGGLSSGFLTPAVLSPNAAFMAAAIKGTTTIECMEALMSDKDFTLSSLFNTPAADKGGAWPNGCSLLSTPAGLLLSPMPPPPKRQRQPPQAAAPAAAVGINGQHGSSGEQQQQQQQVGLSQQVPHPQQQQSNDFRALYQSFRDTPTSTAATVAAAVAGSQTAAATAAAVAAAAAVAVDGAHADDTQGVGDLCDYLLDPNKGDSWLMPPAAAAGAVPASAAAQALGAAPGPAVMAAATAAAGPANSTKPKRQARGGAGQGRRSTAAAPSRQRKATGGSASVPKQQQQQQPQQQQQQPPKSKQQGQQQLADGSKSGVDPDRPFAALFPPKQ